MGGICGFAGLDDEILLKTMSKAISHRGTKTESFIDKNIALCSRFQSNDGGCLGNEDQRIRIVFEGEIYNDAILRSQLEKKNHKFMSYSDAETVLHLFEEFGSSCVKKLRGHFAFAIWDERKRELILVRDRAGQEPLYYALINGSVFFASEIKSILQYEDMKKVLDGEALNYFFLYGHVPAPYTLFHGIKKLPPSYVMKFQKGEGLTFCQYGNLVFKPKTLHEDEWCRIVYHTLRDSVQVMLQKQKPPFSVLLSGGLDSSILASLMNRLTNQTLKFFTITYEEKAFNEPYLKLVTEYLGEEHTEVMLYAKDVVKMLPKLARIYEDPIAELSITIPTYALIKSISQSNVKTIFTGDGSDGLFWGFSQFYDWEKYVRLCKKLPLLIRKNIVKLSQFKKADFILGSQYSSLINVIKASTLPDDFNPLYMGRIFNEEDLTKLYITKNLRSKVHNVIVPNELLKDLRELDTENSLAKSYYAYNKNAFSSVSGLTRLERICSISSLMLRVPFHDHTLEEVTATIPPHLKQPSRNKTKYILRKTALKYNILPKNVIMQEQRSLRSPLDNWYRSELMEYISQTLLDNVPSFLNKEHIGTLIPTKFIDRIYEKILSRRSSSRHIFTLLMFTLWYNEYMRGE